jgi:hypothetical protein
MVGDGDLVDLLLRPDLPAGFERWRLIVPPGTSRATSGEAWAGAMVLVEQGSLEVSCRAGGRREFDQGDMLVLGLLPLRSLRNTSPVELRLLAVRRAGARPRAAFLRVIRRHWSLACTDEFHSADRSTRHETPNPRQHAAVQHQPPTPACLVRRRPAAGRG